MVESIKTKPVSSGVHAASLGGVAVAAAAPVAPARAVERSDGASAELGMRELAGSIAAKPPVDADRVARIRAAIANRTYPILPETIADRMIALKLNWKPE